MSKDTTKALKDRCKELELANLELRKQLELDAKTDFSITPILNPATGKIELYSTVYISYMNTVIPMVRRGIINDDNTVTWTDLPDAAKVE